MTNAHADWSDLIIPIGDKSPYTVEITPRGLTLALYGTTASIDMLNPALSDSLVQRARRIQDTTDRVRF